MDSPVGLGTDADVRPSIIEEMRAASLLQKLAHLDGSAFGAMSAFALGTSQGAAALGLCAGTLHAGAYADYIVLDIRTADPWVPLHNQIVYRAQDADVRETYVGGKLVRTRHQAPPAHAKTAVAKLLPMLKL